MADEFNFDMATKYKPEFKKNVTFQNLYITLAKERAKRDGKDETVYINYIDYIEKEKARVSDVKETSSIRNKLKNQLHFDVKPYADKSNEEFYNALKLLHYIVNTNPYTGKKSSSNQKTISVIDMISDPHLEHTDADNAVFREHYLRIKKELESGVDDADEREKTINWIHSQWQMILKNINRSIVVDAQLLDFDFQEVNQSLEYLLKSIPKQKIIELQRPNEGIIATFYNMLLASNILGEINDMQMVHFDYQNEEPVSDVISELFLSPELSEPTTWEEFKTLISIDKKSLSLLTDLQKLVWTVILRKSNVTIKDIKELKDKGYPFVIKYAKPIAEYWKRTYLNIDTVTLSEWIIVTQELLCIRQNSFTFSNYYHNHKTTDINASLAGAVMHFDRAHQLPRQIIMQRLTHRFLLIYGTNDQLNDKLQTDRYITDLEKIIFSYKNLEDMKAAHNYLFFQVMTLLATDFSSTSIQEKLYQTFQNLLFVMRSPSINIFPDSHSPSYLCFRTLIHVLTQDYYFRLLYDKQYPSNCYVESKKGLITSEGTLKPPKFAYEFLAYSLANTFGCSPSSKNNVVIILPVFYGSGNEYRLYLTFDYSHITHQITLIKFFYTGTDIKSHEIYRDILLKD